MFLLFGWPTSFHSQSIISNPSFETLADTALCSMRAKDWEDACFTPDYYSAKSAMNCVRIPPFCSSQFANTGIQYAGFAVHRNNTDWPSGECMQQHLEKKLEPGKKYLISCYIKFSGYCKSNSVIDRLEADFSPKYFKQDNYSLAKPIYLFPEANGAFLSDSVSWVKVQAFFTASGKEEYLSIGNFRNIFNIRMKPGSTSKLPFAYYLIDDVSLQIVNENKDGISVVSNRIILKEIKFQSGKADILQESFPLLDQLVAYLKTNSSIKLEIRGHTDNVGSEGSNKKLSENRALAIASYLISKGILKDRVSSKGLGSSFPVSDNSKPEGRAENRRVEFVIISR